MSRSKFPQTIVKEKYEPESFKISEQLGGKSPGEIVVHGLSPERSYEDRSVYVSFPVEHCWLQAEDAIALGQLLIKHGTRSLLANMYQHQHIHHLSCLERYIAQGRVKELTMTVIDENPANHGNGFKTYLVKPIWEDGKAPKYDEDFQFETIVYWSPFEEDYRRQLENWWNPTLIGYDRELELEKFKRACEEIEKESHEVVGADPSSENNYSNQNQENNNVVECNNIGCSDCSDCSSDSN